MIQNIKEMEREERLIKITESRYNEAYQRIMREEIPKYLTGKMKWKDRSLIARYRCGNEAKAREYWKDKHELRCRLCGKEEETMEHMSDRCERTRRVELEVFLGAEGEGLAMMKKIAEGRSERD